MGGNALNLSGGTVNIKPTANAYQFNIEEPSGYQGFRVYTSSNYTEFTVSNGSQVGGFITPSGVYGKALLAGGNFVRTAAASLDVKGVGTTSGTTALLVSDATSFPINRLLEVKDDGQVLIGSPTPVGAKLHVQGSGSTSGTTALLVENASGVKALTLLDDISATFGNGTSRSGNAYSNFTAIGRDGQSSVLDAQLAFRHFIFENSNNSLLSIVSNTGKGCSIELFSGTAANSASISNNGSRLDFYAYDTNYSSYHKAKGWYFGAFSQNAVTNGAFDDGYNFVVGGSTGVQLFVGDRTSGVGTVNQGAKLSFQASGYDGTTHTNEIKFQNVTDAAGNYKLEIQDTANTALLSLLGNNGNLGLGVTPTAKLHVKGTGSTSGTTTLLATNAIGSPVIEAKDDTSLGLYGVTPVVQATGAITALAFVANTSGIADDTATYGGYTIGQIAAALKSIGILA